MSCYLTRMIMNSMGLCQHDLDQLDGTLLYLCSQFCYFDLDGNGKELMSKEESDAKNNMLNPDGWFSSLETILKMCFQFLKNRSFSLFTF